MCTSIYRYNTCHAYLLLHPKVCKRFADTCMYIYIYPYHTPTYMFLGMHNLQDVAADDGGLLPWILPVPPCSLVHAELQGLCSDGLH